MFAPHHRKYFSLKSVPHVFDDLLDCSPIKETHRGLWWRAQSSAYIVRFNKNTRAAVDKFKHDHLVSIDANTITAKKVASDNDAVAPQVPSKTIGVFIRESKEKAGELGGRFIPQVVVKSG